MTEELAEMVGVHPSLGGFSAVTVVWCSWKRTKNTVKKVKLEVVCCLARGSKP